MKTLSGCCMHTLHNPAGRANPQATCSHVPCTARGVLGTARITQGVTAYVALEEDELAMQETCHAQCARWVLPRCAAAVNRFRSAVHCWSHSTGGSTERSRRRSLAIVSANVFAQKGHIGPCRRAWDYSHPCTPLRQHARLTCSASHGTAKVQRMRLCSHAERRLEQCGRAHMLISSAAMLQQYSAKLRNAGIYR
jgi:hypothetical protein